MTIYTEKDRLYNTAIAIGTFDGVHLGHQRVLGGLLKTSVEKGLLPVAYTYTSLPLELFSDAAAFRIMTVGQKLAALEAAGVEGVVLCEFNHLYAKTKPDEFVETLVRQFGARHIVVGESFTYGTGAAGNPDTLKAEAKRLGVGVTVVAPLVANGSPVSSTRIRRLIKDGCIESANALLGRRFAIEGEIGRGKQLGREFGIPTVNQLYHERQLLPGFGVYATKISFGVSSAMSITNVGDNPTVGGKRTTVETNIIGFNGDLYGQNVTVEFISRIRGEVKFDSVGALIKQVKRDIARRMSMGI